VSERPSEIQKVGVNIGFNIGADVTQVTGVRNDINDNRENSTKSEGKSTTALPLLATAAFLFFVTTLFLFCREILLPSHPGAKCDIRR
jgi:hypothetical protein